MIAVDDGGLQVRVQADPLAAYYSAEVEHMYSGHVTDRAANDLWWFTESVPMERCV